jgi:hypothetical protein
MTVQGKAETKKGKDGHQSVLVHRSKATGTTTIKTGFTFFGIRQITNGFFRFTHGQQSAGTHHTCFQKGRS